METGGSGIWFPADELEADRLCREDSGGKRGASGAVKCPVCGGKLNYSVAALNGHLWGKCETGGCLHWME